MSKTSAPDRAREWEREKREGLRDCYWTEARWSGERWQVFGVGSMAMERPCCVGLLAQEHANANAGNSPGAFTSTQRAQKTTNSEEPPGQTCVRLRQGFICWMLLFFFLSFFLFSPRLSKGIEKKQARAYLDVWVGRGREIKQMCNHGFRWWMNCELLFGDFPMYWSSAGHVCLLQEWCQWVLWTGLWNNSHIFSAWDLRMLLYCATGAGD